MKLLLILATLLSAQAAEQPNIIFILTDDHRQGDLGCYGNNVVKTPHIDAMAKDGVLFKNASVTSAICTPSRATYFLGQYERRHGINFKSGTAFSQAAWAKSYPVLLRESGYFTGYVGKNHVPIGALGYETGLMEKSFDFWYAGHGHIRFYPKKIHKIFKHARNNTQIELVHEGVHEFLSGKPSYLGGAEKFLSTRPAGRPFCLSICLNVPHGASTETMKLLPEDDELYRTTYRDQLDTLPLPTNYIAKADIQKPKLPADVLYANYRQWGYNVVDTEATVRERRVRQYQTITGIDRMVGKIRKQLEEMKLAENTVIILTSDHGIMMGEHGLGGKSLNYETCLAVPLIVYDPRLSKDARGRKREELVQSIDLAPTLMELGGTGSPNSVQGESFLPLVRGERKTWRTHAFAENLWSTYFGNPRVESVRSKDWKYIRYFKNDRSHWKHLEGVKGPKLYKVTQQDHDLYHQWRSSSIEGEKAVHEELYHLAEDPGEVTNLAGDPAHAGRLAKLRTECRKLVTEAYAGIKKPETVRLPEKSKAR